MSYITKIDPSTEKTVQLGGKNSEGRPNPTSIEGYYLGAKNVETTYGPGKLHVFQTKDGNVGVWGKSNSNRLLTSDLVGQMVLLTFTGMSKPPKGKRPAYLFKVQHDPSNVIDTAGLDLNSPGEGSVDDDAFVGADIQDTATTDDESFDTVEEDQPMDEVPPARNVTRAAPRAAVPDAARQAQVQRLLSGRK